jgi:16S rRNA C1402 (ribose-2'-O) methylase RsmI
LKDAVRAFGQGKKAVLACDLTLPSETIYRGTLGVISKEINGRKAEFILIIY